jgi:hypothetical protein
MIVLGFLYGGRPQEAWMALEEMWPPNDRQRIKEAIIEKSCTGLRADLGLSPGPQCH